MADHFARGGPGAVPLAEALMEMCVEPSESMKPVYGWKDPVLDKITAVAQKIYGASGVVLTVEARQDLKEIEQLGFAGLPICIAKTQNSLSDNPRLRGRPTDFEITVRRILVNSGAGFLVVMTGDIMRMPGLPRRPQAENMDVIDGSVVGIG